MKNKKDLDDQVFSVFDLSPAIYAKYSDNLYTFTSDFCKLGVDLSPWYILFSPCSIHFFYFDGYLFFIGNYSAWVKQYQ